MSFLSRKGAKYSRTDASIFRRLKADVANAAVHNRTMTRILQLPGEIRNEIYNHAIWPLLPHISIIRNKRSKDECRLPFTPQFPALGLGIFYVSKQIRAEALSYFAANKVFSIIGVDTANCLFRALGPAVKNVKRVALSLYLSVNYHTVGSAEEIDNFFAFMEQTKTLLCLELVIGSLEVPLSWDEEISDGNWAFLDRVVGFVKSRDGMVFRWGAGKVDEGRGLESSASKRNRGVKKLLGEEKEVELDSVGELPV